MPRGDQIVKGTQGTKGTLLLRSCRIERERNKKVNLSRVGRKRPLSPLGPLHKRHDGYGAFRIVRDDPAMPTRDPPGNSVAYHPHHRPVWVSAADRDEPATSLFRASPVPTGQEGRFHTTTAHLQVLQASPQNEGRAEAHPEPWDATDENHQSLVRASYGHAACTARLAATVVWGTVETIALHHAVLAQDVSARPRDLGSRRRGENR